MGEPEGRRKALGVRGVLNSPAGLCGFDMLVTTRSGVVPPHSQAVKSLKTSLGGEATIEESVGWTPQKWG